DLGVTPAPELTAGALSTVPMVAGLWPVLLTGLYAVSKRKEKIEKIEQQQAIASTLEKANAEAESKLSKALAKAQKEKDAAIKREVKKALEEAKKTQEKEGS
ncbi:MAG: hypothetical protein WBB70_02385, partial [Desulfobacterales bacterium]